MGSAMEVGKKVVLLYDGGKGTITHFAQALVPDTAASLQRVVSSFPSKDLSGEGKAVREIVHFKDKAGVTQVSLIVLRQEVLASACGCVVHELFEYLLSNAPIQSSGFTLVVPAISRMPGSTLNVDTSKNVNIYTAFVNGTPENTGALGQFPKLPSTFAVKDGLLACIFHYAHATGLPTLVLVGPSTEGVAAQKKGSNEVLHTLADVVGRQVGLTCSMEKLNNVANTTPLIDSVEDDWRRFYI